MVSWFLVSPEARLTLQCLSKNPCFDTCHRGPTALDALAFAYLYTLLSGPDDLRLEVSRRTNLCNWERRVREIVQASFVAV